MPRRNHDLLNLISQIHRYITNLNTLDDLASYLGRGGTTCIVFVMKNLMLINLTL